MSSFGTWKAHKICREWLSSLLEGGEDKTNEVKFVVKFEKLHTIAIDIYLLLLRTAGGLAKRTGEVKRPQMRMLGNIPYFLFSVRVWHDFLGEKSNRLVMPSPQTWEFCWSLGLTSHILVELSCVCVFFFSFCSVLGFILCLAFLFKSEWLVSGVRKDEYRHSTETEQFMWHFPSDFVGSFIKFWQLLSEGQQRKKNTQKQIWMESVKYSKCFQLLLSFCGANSIQRNVNRINYSKL